MTWPAPVPGLVVRYGYLWLREARAGREEGVKDRPCAVVLVMEDDWVSVLPITHSPPQVPADALEIPLPVKRRLGLDDDRAWIVLSELNQFRWPGPDLRFARGGGPETIVFGQLPRAMMAEIRERVIALLRSGDLRVVTRTE